MVAVIDRHIEADADDRRRPKLEDKVHGMEATIPAPADFGERVENEVIDALPRADRAPVRKLQKRVPILCDLQAFEVLRAIVDPNPGAVARVENVSPRNELIGVVDRDPL
jgi:hypothetical protein